MERTGTITAEAVTGTLWNALCEGDAIFEKHSGSTDRLPKPQLDSAALKKGEVSMASARP